MNYVNSRIVVRKKLLDGWETLANSYTIDVNSFKVVRTIDDSKDTFQLMLDNADNKIFRRYFNGTGDATTFTLAYPPPNDYLGDKTQFNVLVGGVEYEYVSAGPGANQYTLATTVNNNDTLTFGSAPASGTKNIEVRFPIIGDDDIVRIYRYKNTGSYDNDDIVDEGFVTDVNVRLMGNSRDVEVKGEGLVNVLLRALTFVAYSGTLNRAHLVIQNVIAAVNSYNPLKNLFGDNTNDWNTLGNATTSTPIQYSSSYRPAHEIIQELSGGQYTGAGQYYYYVEYDATNDRFNFIWKQRPVPPTATITEGTEIITQLKCVFTNDDVFNYAIYNCGDDCYNNVMEYLFFDFSTGAGRGGKWKYITNTFGIGQQILDEEFDSATWNTSTAEDGIVVATERFPKDASYPYTMAFESRDASHQPDGGALSAADDEDFNQYVREEARWRGWFRVKDMVDLYSKGRPKVNMTVAYGESSTTFTLGEVYTLFLPSFGLFNANLRLVRIDYEPHQTTCQFVEDERCLPP